MAGLVSQAVHRSDGGGGFLAALRRVNASGTLVPSVASVLWGELIRMRSHPAHRCGGVQPRAAAVRPAAQRPRRREYAGVEREGHRRACRWCRRCAGRYGGPRLSQTMQHCQPSARSPAMPKRAKMATDTASRQRGSYRREGGAKAKLNAKQGGERMSYARPRSVLGPARSSMRNVAANRRTSSPHEQRWRRSCRAPAEPQRAESRAVASRIVCSRTARTSEADHRPCSGNDDVAEHGERGRTPPVVGLSSTEMYGSPLRAADPAPRWSWPSASATGSLPACGRRRFSRQDHRRQFVRARARTGGRSFADHRPHRAAP